MSCEQLLGEEASYAADSLTDTRPAAGVAALATWRRSVSGPTRTARCVVACGWSVPERSRVVGCCRRTVRPWLQAFLAAGLAGLPGRRPGPRTRPPRATAADDPRLLRPLPLAIAWC